MKQVAESCKTHGAADVELYPFDLLKTNDIDSIAQKILAEKQLDVLVNNAGIMTPGSAYEGQHCCRPLLLICTAIIIILQACCCLVLLNDCHICKGCASKTLLHCKKIWAASGDRGFHHDAYPFLYCKNDALPLIAVVPVTNVSSIKHQAALVSGSPFAGTRLVGKNVCCFKGT